MSKFKFDEARVQFVKIFLDLIKIFKFLISEAQKKHLRVFLLFTMCFYKLSFPHDLKSETLRFVNNKQKN